jgi:acyl carrier protein
VLGSQERAHYAAANAFLDALATERRRLGLAALSVNWGPWDGGGMAAASELEKLARVGHRGLEPDAALDVLDRLMACPVTNVSVVDIDWNTFAPAYGARRRRPVLTEIDTARSSPALGARAAPWVQQLMSVEPVQRRPILVELLRRELTDVLGFDSPASVPSDRSFSDIGVDSLMMADLVSRLNKQLGLSSSNLLFEHPTVASLAVAFLERVSPPEPVVRGGVVAGEPAAAANGTVGYEAALEQEVFGFQAQAWPHRDRHMIPARWRWMFVESAHRLDRSPIVWLHRDNGAIVGHMGAIPVKLKIQGTEHDTAWCVDTMVLESHRSKAVGSRLMVDARETLPFALSLGQTSEMRQICLRLGWKQVAPLQSAQLIVRPENVLRGKLPAPAAWAAGLGLRAGTAVRELLHDRRGPPRPREVSRFDARHDQLWRESSRGLSCAVVRDSSYLNWKYVEQPGQHFVRVELLDDEKVCGIAVWMLREPDDTYRYSRGFLVELVAPLNDAAQLRRVIRAASSVPIELGAHALVCLHINASLTRALRDCGFILRQPERFLLVDPGPLTGAALACVLSGESWYVTQGDSDIDRPW